MIPSADFPHSKNQAGSWVFKIIIWFVDSNFLVKVILF